MTEWKEKHKLYFCESGQWNLYCTAIPSVLQLNNFLFSTPSIQCCSWLYRWTQESSAWKCVFYVSLIQHFQHYHPLWLAVCFRIQIQVSEMGWNTHFVKWQILHTQDRHACVVGFFFLPSPLCGRMWVVEWGCLWYCEVQLTLLVWSCLSTSAYDR